MNIRGQGHSLTLVLGHSESIFLNFFFLETAWPIEAKFYVELRGMGGRKFDQRSRSHDQDGHHAHIW